MSDGTVVVIGAGTMGRGIARVAAEAGYRTHLVDVSSEQLEAAIADIAKGQEKGIAKGKLDAEVAARAKDLLSTATDAASVSAGADWVIEAVPENPELKAKIYASLELGAATRVGSNTSSLPISKLAEGVSDAGRFIGIHFFNPVPIMGLVEVVRGEQTSDETVEAAVEFARTLGKTPVVVNDSPGFATSRLGVLLGLEGIRMVESGVAAAADIDTAMELGYRHPMGPLKLTDLVGLDVRLSIAETLHRELGSAAFEPPQLLRTMVANGRLGKKSGRGFYDWSDGSPQRID